MVPVSPEMAEVAEGRVLSMSAVQPASKTATTTMETAAIIAHFLLILRNKSFFSFDESSLVADFNCANPRVFTMAARSSFIPANFLLD
jgi:hypothetical protein